MITDKLYEIPKSYDPLRIKKMISCNGFVCKNSQNPHFSDGDKLQQQIPKNEQNLEADKPPYNEVDFLSLRVDRIGTENLS